MDDETLELAAVARSFSVSTCGNYGRDESRVKGGGQTHLEWTTEPKTVIQLPKRKTQIIVRTLTSQTRSIVWLAGCAISPPLVDGREKETWGRGNRRSGEWKEGYLRG